MWEQLFPSMSLSKPHYDKTVCQYFNSMNSMIVLNKVDMTVNSLSTDRSDFTATGCGTNIQLRLSSSSEVGISAVADDKIEGTEILMLQLVLTSATQTAVNNAGNIFIQDTLNIRVIDVTGNYKLNGDNDQYCIDYYLWSSFY